MHDNAVVCAMTATQRVGVLGTLVNDVIHGPPPQGQVSEGWGGIAYALSGMSAALSDAWEIVPFIKTGADVVDAARPWVAALPRMAPDARLLSVDAPNNRSELRYLTAEHRTERMSGGVPPWTREALLTALSRSNVNALYVNFLSGIEVDLATMQAVRASFRGPIYVDLHMMLWETDSTGRRTLRPLRDAAAWCACFDVIQVNEDEMRMLADSPDALSQLAMSNGAHTTFVTLGSRGVHFSSRHSGADSGQRVHEGIQPPEAVRAGASIDPTGCGDVWGSTACARLLAGDALRDVLLAANRAAGLNATLHGVEGLAARLVAAHANPGVDAYEAL